MLSIFCLCDTDDIGMISDLSNVSPHAVLATGPSTFLPRGIAASEATRQEAA